VVPSDRIRDNRHKLENRKVNLNMRKNFFTLGVTEHWSRLPGEVVDSPSLEIFKTHLVSCVTYSKEPALAKGVGSRLSPEAPSNPTV